MRLSCEVIFVRYKANAKSTPNPTKPQKGIMILQKTRQTPPLYQITVAVAGDKTGNKFELNKPLIIIDKFVAQGKSTITFQTTPAVMVCISKACPDGLSQFIDSIKRIGKGEVVDVEKVKVKSSDFKPTTITVTNQQDYRKQMHNCSDFLKTLIIGPIDLRRPDSTWKRCRNLTRLSISGNPIGNQNRDLSVFGNLKNLQILEMRNCALHSIPVQALCDLFKGLPSSLTTLDFGENQLTVFPPVYHLGNLRVVNVSHNRIKYLPSRIGVLRNLNTIDMSHNLMSSLPYIFPRISTIQHVGIHANDELVRPLQELRAPVVRRLSTKVDQLSYSHDGGVDSLEFIAANALHREECKKSMMFGRQILPLCLRFQVDDLLYEKPGISSLELCTGCTRLRHIRYVRPLMVQSRLIANSVDVIDRFVIFDNLLCIDCYRKNPTVVYHEIPIQHNYFDHSV